MYVLPTLLGIGFGLGLAICRYIIPPVTIPSPLKRHFKRQ